MNSKSKRIWELDAIRGFCILCMIVVHLVYDLVYFGGLQLNLPAWYMLIKHYGNVFFILISGICVTLSSRCVRRGAIVFAAGLLTSYVTLFMDLILGMEELRIWFGILHMLGLSMMLYPLFKKLPPWALALLGLILVGLGYWFDTFYISVDFLFPLGLCSETVFVGSDFVPMLPGFGWFLIGAFLGKTLYKEKESLLPSWNAQNPIFKFFQLCGRYSLPIYLLHQPILAGLTSLLNL